MGTNPSKNIIYGKVFNTLFADYNKFLNEKDFEWLLQNVEYIINEHGGDMTKDGAGSKNLFTFDSKGNLLSSDSNSMDKSKAVYFNARYKSRLNSFLASLCPERIDNIGGYQYKLALCAPGFHFPIHDDGNKKILSSIIYLWPPHSTGTKIHKSRASDSPSVEIPWKQNKCFAFSPIEGVTWHSYGNAGNVMRVTLLINTVCEDQNKNIEITKKLNIEQYAKRLH